MEPHVFITMSIKYTQVMQFLIKHAFNSIHIPHIFQSQAAEGEEEVLLSHFKSFLSVEIYVILAISTITKHKTVIIRIFEYISI